MPGQKLDLRSFFEQSATPRRDGDYPNSLRPSGGGVAPNSGAVLSGGTILRGPYDYASGAKPADSDYFAGVNTGGTLTYNELFAKGVYAAGSSDTAVYTTVYRQPVTNHAELYIEFDARMSLNNHGVKFIKPVSKSGTGYANFTFGLDYTNVDNGSLSFISYGDGTTITNDTQNFIDLRSPTGGALIGRAPSPKVNCPVGPFASTDWSTAWHHFRIYFKYNEGTTAGNEVANGAFYLEIDGVLYADVGGIFNRHYSNTRAFDGIGLFGVTQNNPLGFTLEYDNVTVSTGGFA